MSVSKRPFRNSFNVKTPEPFRRILKALPEYQFELILDVGAHIGETLAAWAPHVGEAAFHCFEPVAKSFRELEHIARSMPNVELHQVALGAEQGLAWMTNSRGSSNRFTDASEAPREEVHVITLDLFAAEQEVPWVSVLKIDTEGHDLEVLRGAIKILSKTDFVVCEVSMNDYNKFHVSLQDISAWLSGKGFYLFHLYALTLEWGAGGVPVLRRANAVFINATLVGDIDLKNLRISK